MNIYIFNKFIKIISKFFTSRKKLLKQANIKKNVESTTLHIET